MKIIVTGGTGFIGKHLVKKLVDEDHKVTCIVRESSDTKTITALGAEIAYADLLNSISIKRTVEKENYDIVFHLAGNVYARNNFELYKSNYEVTQNLYDACINSGINKFIFLSSLAALGPSHNSAELDEDAKPRPITEYGRSKYLAESYLMGRINKNDLSVFIVRAPLVYGAGMSKKSRLYSILKLAKYGFLLRTSSKNVQFPLCHLYNLLILFGSLATKNNLSQGIYHIRDTNYYTLPDIRQSLEYIFRKKMRTLYLPPTLQRLLITLPFVNKDLVSELQYNWTLAINKIKKEFDFEPVNSLGEFLPAILQSFDLM